MIKGKNSIAVCIYCHNNRDVRVAQIDKVVYGIFRVILTLPYVFKKINKMRTLASK